MAVQKTACKNMNHSKMNPSVKFCPSCGQKFNSASTSTCDDEKHRERIKQGSIYCHDCGKKIRS